MTVRGTVTAFSGWKNSFFLQDETGGISVDRLEQTEVHTGDRVEVAGTLQPGLFAPVILSSSIQILARGVPEPAALTVPYEQLVTGRFDSNWVAVRGIVHAARIAMIWDHPALVASVAVPGGSISVHILDYSGIPVNSLVDSEVTLRGVCGTEFNDRRQIIGVRLFVPDGREVKTEAAAPDPARIQASEIAELQRYSPGDGSLHRVKMTGTLTYQSREHGWYLEQNGAAIHLQTRQPDSYRLGTRLEVLGFPHNFGYSPGLQDAQVVRTVGMGEVKPTPVDAAEVITTRNGFQTTLYDGRLVEMKAMVVEQVAGSQSEVWLLRSGDVLFQAELGGAARPHLEAHSSVVIEGICVADIDDNGFPASFRVLLRSPQDISIAEAPSAKPLLVFVFSTLVLLVGGGIALRYFERTSGPGMDNELGPERLEALRARFQMAARVLPQIVLAAVALSFAGLPLGVWQNGAPEWAGPAGTRAALALAALAIWWNGSARRWQSLVSAACLVLVPAVAFYQLWQQSTEPAAGAVCLCALGLAALLWRRRPASLLAQILFAGVGAMGVFNMVTRCYGAATLYGMSRMTNLPALLAVGLMLLSAAALCSRPGFGLMKTLSSPGLGGLVGRRLLPAAFVPIFIGWLRLQGQLAGLYDTLWGLALFAMSNVVSFGCIIWTSAAVLNRLDAARSKVAEALRERDRRLGMLFEKSGIGDYTWDIAEDTVRFHPIVWKLYGGEGMPESAPGDWFRSRQHPDDAPTISRALENALRQDGELDVEFRVLLPDGGLRWISCRGNVLCDEAGKPVRINGLNLDVTARKRSEAAVRKGMEALREADQQLRTSLELAKVPVWRWMSATNVIRWSGPVESVYGRPAAELSNLEQVNAIMHPDDVAELTALMSRGLSSGTSYEAQFRIFAGGEVRWLAGRGNVMRDSNGEVCGLTGVNFDITAMKLAEQHVIESEGRFRELADAMPQIVFSADASAEVQYLNRQWYDYTQSSSLAEPYDFIHPDDLETVRSGFRKALENKSSFEFELRLKRGLDQVYRWHLTRAVPVMDAAGELTGWYGTSTDVEDFKQAQMQVERLNADLERRVLERSAELAESELRYRLLVEEVKDYAILLLDPHGMVKSWNKGAEQLTGYAAADILGKHFSVFHNAASVAAGEPDRYLAEAVADERSKEEGWRKRQDGSEFWASVVTTSLWDSNSQLRGFSQIIRDMTEQRRVEGLLNKRAESATEAKSAFLASVSHEIRTPMNAILGMADMLWESELNQSQRHYVEIFRRAGGSLLTLINDILDLSKIESGSFCLEEVDFDLTTLIEQVIEILTPKAESKAISLRAQLGFVAAPTVVGDPVRLQQILLNLLGNAIKFTDQGEVVLRVQCHADESFATVEFAVSDTGIGIPANKLETIFDDFEQAETSTTRRFGGTGLGLGISRRLVRRMRGEIHAESELGKGSTFSFSLILPVGTSQKPLEHSQMDDIEGKQVLIVDPSAVNRVILSEMCSAWGMGVTNCSTGTEALELLRTSGQPQRFALALLDRTMPGLDGFETAEQMQCVDPGIAIFIVSSDSQAGDVARCRELGLAGHLMKPVRRAELLEQVVRALSRRSEADATRVTVLSAEHQAVARRYRILAAEDSEDNRFLLHVYCEGSIYDLTFVEDGERAVAAYQGQQFDLIVMDIQMPVMDGLTATRTIRALERTSGVKRIPILALTANALPEDVSRARDAGCDAHLSKPISKKNFLAGMEQWLAKSAPAVPEPALAAPEAPLVHIEIPEGFEQLSPRYLASRQKELPLLRELLERSDFDTLRRLSHNMKGTGTSYGFPDISRLGAALEQAAKAGNESDFAQQITKLAAYIEAANVQLHDLVQTNSGD